MKLDKRIAFYTEKVAEYGRIHVTRRRNQYRYDRLVRYKRRLDELAIQA